MFVGIKFVDPDKITEEGNDKTYAVPHIEGRPKVSSTSKLIDIAEGKFPDHTPINKFGYNASVGSLLEPIWSIGGDYPYLTSAEVLQVVSGDVDDQGLLRSEGTATGGASMTLEDTGATFLSDSVAEGDIVLDDTNNEEVFVLTVDSETQITFKHSKDTPFTLGTVYRIVNANDTGASVVRVLGQDEECIEQSEAIILNGQTDVPTTLSYYRVYRAYVLHAGSSGTNEGDISIENNDSDTILAQIRATMAQTEMALWTVPQGRTLYITNLHGAEINNKRITLQIYHRLPGGVFRPDGGSISMTAASDNLHFFIPLKFNDHTDIEIRGLSSVALAIVHSGFLGWHEGN